MPNWLQGLHSLFIEVVISSVLQILCTTPSKKSSVSVTTCIS